MSVETDGGVDRSYPARVVEKWVWDLVVGLNLCPFARRELEAGRVRITVSPALSAKQLLADLDAELATLRKDRGIETTLLIHPQQLQDFSAYLDFLDLADALLETRGDRGVFQLAGFHPEYCFENATCDDAANYTNRSPYPMLHLLREAGVSKAVASHPDVSSIPAANMARLRKLGAAAMESSWNACFEGTDTG
ncbi:MAG: DUF1415 domain-containing protein [Pseudomonadota bacterium]